VKDLTAVQWTPRLEAKLEEMLIRNAFDFKLSAKELQRHLNSPECPDSMQSLFYKIDAKTLQLKWTDIEIRKHVIPDQQKKEAEASNESLEDDLPPLEQLEEIAKTETLASSEEKEHPPSPERSNVETIPSSGAAVPRETPVFNYSSDSSEERDSRSSTSAASNPQPQKVVYTKHTDLEELD